MPTSLSTPAGLSVARPTSPSSRSRYTSDVSFGAVSEALPVSVPPSEPLQAVHAALRRTEQTVRAVLEQTRPLVEQASGSQHPNLLRDALHLQMVIDGVLRQTHHAQRIMERLLRQADRLDDTDA